MCTLSTAASDSSFLVTMNRDERRHRVEGPLFKTSDCCYPTDALAGGTWCGINRFGLIFCLLNRYDAPLSDAKSMISRGNLIPKALECQTANEASDYIASLDLARFNGFRLQVFSNLVCRQIDWDRSSLSSMEHENGNGIFSSSSSLRSLTIPVKREHHFRAWQQQRDNSAAPICGEIPAIHLPNPSVPPSEAMFMVRRDTHTKSICQLGLFDGQAHLHYWPAQFGFDSDRVESWSVQLQGVNCPAIENAKTGH